MADNDDPSTPKLTLGERVRARLNAQFDWSVEGRAKAHVEPKNNAGRSLDATDRLPRQSAPLPAGAVKRGTPSRHEMALLRRAAASGGVLVTQTEHGPVYVFASDGAVLRDASGKPFDAAGFKRLQLFLVPDKGDSLFDLGPAQRWRVREHHRRNGGAA